MTLAEALNSDDVIVGQGTDGDEYTCMMYAQGTLIDLQKALSNPGGWAIEDCVDIDDAGVIVGNGWLDGQRHAFMLTPD